jgi:hypothetical protein
MPEIIYPYSYRAYGLNVLSEIRVTGFEPASFDEAEVHIQTGTVPETLDPLINRGVLYESNAREFKLHIDQVADYYVKDGGEIVVQPLGKASEGEISAFIIGSIFGALLHQRRMLPLHASTVIFKGKCLVFAGISGAGKTTLAAALIKAGGSLVADDISVISFSGEKPFVRPAFPTIKIWKDSLSHLGLSAAGLEPVRDELEKYYLPVQNFKIENIPINHVFVLHSHNRETIEMKDLQGIDKFIVLKKHTYFFRGLPKTGLEQNHFVLVNQLANLVPVTTLIRPNGEFNTDRLISELIKYLDS